jgi:hypothetical protein
MFDDFKSPGSLKAEGFRNTIPSEGYGAIVLAH